MRVLRLLPFGVLLSIPLPAQTTPQAQRDPQAVAVVEAAIVALGGTAAINQARSWTFQGQVAGLEEGNRSETISLDPGPGTEVTAFPSPFVPALLGALLLKESRDPNYSIRYGGQTTIGSQSVAAVTFLLTRTLFATAQNWYFDSTTGLPEQVEFRFPVRIGRVRSIRGVTVVSDYRSVSGVLYPFEIVTAIPGKPLPETITLQSISPSTTASAPAGGAR